MAGQNDGARVLLVAPRDSSLRGLDHLDVTLDMVQSSERYTDVQAQRADRVEIVDLNDEQSVMGIARSLHRSAPFDGVTALHERHLDLGARIAADLGVRGQSREVVRRAADKVWTRELAGDCGLGQPRFSRVEDATGLRAGLQQVGLPAVVKPLRGAGSAHVLAVPAAIDIARVELEMAGAGGPWIVEQYVEGPEFSVESFTREGVTAIRAVTAKVLDETSFVEMGHQMPADLPPLVAERVQVGVTRLLEAVGMRVGPAHTEVRISAGQPYLIETHARYGGDRIWEMTGMVTGYYPQAEMIAAMAGLTLRPAPIETPAAAVRFINATPGVVDTVTGIEQARAVSGVVEVDVTAVAGDRVSSLRSSEDRLGHVLAHGSSAAVAVQAAERAAELVDVGVRGGSG